MPSRRRRIVLAACVLAAGLGAVLVLATRAGRPGSPPVRPDGAGPAAGASGRAPAPRAVPQRLAVWLAPAASGTPAPAAPNGAFEGRVVSTRSGDGLARAHLTFARTGETASVSAGPDGAFRFEPHAPGGWVLAAATADGHLPFAPDWGQSSVLLAARPGEVVRGLVVALEPAEPFEGRVVDPGGAPVEGAEVRILGGGAGAAALVPLADRLRSGAGGTFRFTAPEDAVIEARREGFSPGRARLDPSARVSRRVTIRLGAPGAARLAIGGVVEARDGSPGEGAIVVASAKGPPSEPSPSARADAAGRFRLDDLAPGGWILTASRAGAAPASVEATAGAEGVRIRLAAGGALAGRVRDRRTGAPVAAFTVLVQSSETRSVSFVDPGGRYTLDDLSPGPAVVQVFAPGHAPSAEVRTVVPEPGEPPTVLDFDLGPGGGLAGVVVERGSGRPIAAARVEVEGTSASLGVPIRNETVTDREGRFTLVGLAASPVGVLAFAAGRHGRIVAVPPIPEGETRGPVTIELAPVAAGEEPRIELAGIGAMLRKDGDVLRVERVVPGGGAAEAGLGPGDEILSIDGAAVRPMTLADAIPLLRGPEGTTVRLVVVKSGDAGRTPVPVAVPRRLVRG